MIARMRSRVLELCLLVVLAAGCRSSGTPSRTSSGETLARCVGGGPGGRGPVVAGAENEYFTASSRHVITIKPGIESKGVPGKDGKPHGLTLIARDNSLDLTCGCPGGCSEAGESGCVYIVVIGSSQAVCTGDCEKTGACCAGCGWY
jgi:hypothetical protein